MNFGLQNKVALITGGSHGIGLAIAVALAKEGCNIAILARGAGNLGVAEGLIKECGVKCIGIQLDVTLPPSAEGAMKRIMAEFGALHILVNNAGGGGRWGKDVLEETKEAVWLQVYSKNALAAVRFTMAAMSIMRAQKWGRVVTIASIHGKEGDGRPWFTMAKSAEIALMKTLARNPRLVGDGLTFNSVAPGSIMISGTGWETEARRRPDAYKTYCESLPLGRLGTPEEVAAVVAFLCSEQASLVNGATIAVDGGESRSF